MPAVTGEALPVSSSVRCAPEVGVAAAGARSHRGCHPLRMTRGAETRWTPSEYWLLRGREPARQGRIPSPRVHPDRLARLTRGWAGDRSAARGRPGGGAVAAIVSQHLEEALTRRFGVELLGVGHAGRGRVEPNGERHARVSGRAVSHFADRHKLPFTLLSDRDGQVRMSYGVPAVLGLLPGRVTYVIDRRARSGTYSVNSITHINRHINDALEVVRQLLAGQPA